MSATNNDRTRAAAGVHAPIRPDWLTLVDEPLMVPDIAVVDSHHHLWDRSDSTFLLDDFLADIDTVPTVASTVYAQCRSCYLTDGPEEFRPVGEVRFARAVAEDARQRRPDGPRVCEAIVAAPDLTLGRGVERVLDLLEEEADGRLRGVRNQTAWHADPRVVSSPRPPSPGRLREDSFIDGARVLGRRGLTLDIWAYHTQLADVRDLAAACPDTTIVVDHFGGPVGIGPYAGIRDAVYDDWKAEMAALATYPNVVLKLSGAGLRVMGFGFDDNDTPPTSVELARGMAPLFQTCVDLFSPARCMLGSNFPVDKGMFSYRVLWNAFATLAAPLTPAEQRALFHATACAVYTLDPVNP
ncbi:amidohydrolase family protein [Mycolicibacterium sp. 018/SC-01/001]|uniref:amidohydrolase family protein n=1 Tax=Mycolicibacterium sp. 018/SC-01/001 TaxID=2592069 RepID=UPI00117CD961|nr:amidohydrolase family protein [Mycolicibacterium sp. 018/SC-01/001]TRW80949.1 amidohydrolase family protein [Mycolicibacterium sp. 018/SC-01/001]